jgi:hypothetical protein
MGLSVNIRLKSSSLSIHYVRILSVFLSQWDFGTVDQKYRNIPPYTDTRENRIRWFVHCLNQLKALNIKSVGLPYQIATLLDTILANK